MAPPSGIESREVKMKSKLSACFIGSMFAVACVATACGFTMPSGPANSSSPAASNSPSSNAPSGATSNASYAEPPAAGGSRNVTINDPILNMKAYSLTIPGNWMFQGAVFQGSPCEPGAFAVIRTESPDGLTGMKLLPRLDWAWMDTQRGAQSQGSNACLPYTKEVSASEMMRYIVGVLKVKFVQDMPVPWLAGAKQNAARGNDANHQSYVDIAMAMDQYHINNITIDERLKVYVSCLNIRTPQGLQHYCSAQVFRYWSPQGRNAADTDMFNTIEHSIAIDSQWQRAFDAEITQKIREVYAHGNQILQGQMDQANARMKAQYNSFNQAQEMRQQQHQDFMDTLQRGTDMSMKQAAASADANHKAAGDWADYSLGLQKRLNPSTGEISKDSAAYTYSWISDSGAHFETDNPNDNPNGNGNGNWTLSQKVF
jgi:hypothetical protein